MPSDLQRESFIKWLSTELAEMGLDSLYTSYLVSMLEKGGDAGCYLKTVAENAGNISKKDLKKLLNELNQRWYGCDDDNDDHDDILSLSHGCSPVAAFIDDFDDHRNVSDARETSTVGTLTPIFAPCSAVRPVFTPSDTWNGETSSDKVVDIFGSQLSFDTMGLSAKAKEFTPGSLSSEEPRYLRGESNTSRVGSLGVGSGIDFPTTDKSFGNCGLNETETSFPLQEFREFQPNSDTRDGKYYLSGNGSDVFFDELRFEGIDDEQDENQLLSHSENLEAEMVSCISTNFPDCAEECLLLALREADYDIDFAGDIIQGAFVNASEKNQKQPCRHFISGECLRKDCMFSHDFASTICRYWLQGVCRNGYQCMFVHNLTPVTDVLVPNHSVNIEVEPTNSTLVTQKDSFHGVVAEDFPALSTMESRSAAVYSTSFGASSPQKSYMSVLGTSPLPVTYPRRDSNDDVPCYNVGKMRSGSISGAHLNANHWVSTGESVSEQYRQMRNDAAEYARCRNKYFMSATQAYRRGDVKDAKFLAEKGRNLNAQMKEKHRKAARCIYEARNHRKQVIEKKALDLHGLHVAEATALLEEELPNLCLLGLTNVNLITGTGHHSRGSNYKARLLPAVERFCLEWGLYFERVVDKNGHVGMLHVSLDKHVLLGDYEKQPCTWNEGTDPPLQQRITIIK